MMSRRSCLLQILLLGTLLLWAKADDAHSSALLAQGPNPVELVPGRPRVPYAPPARRQPGSKHRDSMSAYPCSPHHGPRTKPCDDPRRC
ncbi:hypothetical protein BRADI_4g13207v3 [Brachypodium distachyon]|uniref:Uncharacterized protein n=1 Tax=Brachypodium distachyon TaxID=15368 RepID=A0A0Q3L4X8_BRADI|nr:hypothetical protein BRADI_4g13207v3 [Brachypodium distachyon]